MRIQFAAKFMCVIPGHKFYRVLITFKMAWVVVHHSLPLSLCHLMYTHIQWLLKYTLWH